MLRISFFISVPAFSRHFTRFVIFAEITMRIADRLRRVANFYEQGDGIMVSIIDEVSFKLKQRRLGDVDVEEFSCTWTRDTV